MTDVMTTIAVLLFVLLVGAGLLVALQAGVSRELRKQWEDEEIRAWHQHDLRQRAAESYRRQAEHAGTVVQMRSRSEW